MWCCTMQKSQMIECIKKGRDAYEQIVNKEIHYVYKKDNVYKEVILRAKKNGFMHLCGVDYLDPKTKQKVAPKHFYQLVKDNKISPDFLVEKADGTTILKLGVIGNLKDLLTSNIRVIDGHVTFFNSTFDVGLRTGRQIFALSLIEEKRYSEFYVPMSLLNLKTASKAALLKKSYEVHCIYSKDRYGTYIYYENEKHEEIRLAGELKVIEEKTKRATP